MIPTTMNASRVTTMLRLSLGAASAMLLSAGSLWAIPAFPGAEGFGASAIGGRSATGEVYHVTTLDNSGTGSFRDAVSVSGRTVVFDVGGVINISSVVVVQPNITIAGQTAPGGGVTIYGNRISFSDASNTICRYMRFREGISGDSGTDAVGIASGSNMIFDHVSASWGRDETFSISGSAISNITLQDCIIGQGLLTHSAGGLIQTSGGVSIFRSLYADNWMRNPKIKGVNDYQNNVVYNWGSGGGYIPAGDSAGLTYANMVGCYFIGGPNSGVGTSPFKTGNANYHLYHINNLQDLDLDGTLNGSTVGDNSFTTLTLMSTAYDYPAPATVLSPLAALQHVVNYAGASLHRDSVDAYMINELLSYGTAGAQISNESEVGGVGTVASGLAPTDTDGDGMPDWWESAAGTDPTVADHNGDINGDGYSNLENYINSLAIVGVPAVTITGISNDTGSSATDGVTTDNTLVIHGTTTAGATVTISRVDTGAIGTAVADSSGTWFFDYTSTVLADRYYAFTATVDLGSGVASLATPAFVVKVDTASAEAPVITNIVTSSGLVVSGTAEAYSTVTVYVNGTAIGTAQTDGTGSWSLSSAETLGSAAYTFTATAVDLAGNASSSVSGDYVVDTTVASPVFTSITTDSGTTGDFITKDTTLILNGTAPVGATVTVTRVGTGVIGTATANASGVWAFDYTGTTLASGTYYFTATASLSGSSSPASTVFTVTVDTVAPTISSINRLNPSTASTLSSTLVYRVTFAEPVQNVDTGDFTLTTSGTSMTGSIASLAAVSTSVYNVTVTGAGGDGTIRLDRKASSSITDLAANSGSSSTYTSGQTYTMRTAGSGLWTSTESGGLWSDSDNWDLVWGSIPNGTGTTADFSYVDPSSNTTVVLDSARTLGRLVTGDVDYSTPMSWTITNNGNSANTLTLSSSSTPTIQVDAEDTSSADTVDVPTANSYPTIMDASLVCSTAWTKLGLGTLKLTQPNPGLTGALTVTRGIVEVGEGGTFTPSAVTLATSQQIRVSGGTFSTGNITWTSGTGTGIIVSGGTAHFTKIVPSNTRNSFVKVTGGVLTADDISFPRSADSESTTATGSSDNGVLISGGEATIGTIGLGTTNSWGGMNVSGGKITVTGVIHNGYQVTAARGGVIYVSGGELDVLDSAYGLIMSRNPGTQANNISRLWITGGVTNLAKMTIGYDSTSTAGTATISVTSGELNIGTGGIVKNGTSGMTSTITLNSGTLGTIAAWSTTHPIVLAGTSSNTYIRAGDSSGNSYDIALTGVLSGTGGFAKTGAGQLTLSAVNTFTGDVAVNAGTLLVSGSLASGGNVTVNSGGKLVVTGTLNRAIVLGDGGIIAPGVADLGEVTGSSLTWNSGGSVAVALDTGSDGLAISGALLKGTAGTYTFACTTGTSFAAGNVYTVASFGSTDFSASDFSATGLPAGFAASFAIVGNTLQMTIVGTPYITSAATAAGTYGESFNYTIVAGNVPTSFSASGLPPGLELDTATGAISGTPTAAGTYTVGLGATNIAGTGTATLTITIAKAPATVTLSNLLRSYTGQPLNPTATTEPADLNVVFTYEGLSSAPTYPGTYAVTATIDEANYVGSTTGSFTIVTTATVRHAPTLNGEVDGSVQMFLGEWTTLNSGALVSLDLLVPGTPTIYINGKPTYGGTIDATGLATPTSYGITLNSGAVLRQTVRRIDALTLPTVASIPQPSGTRYVYLNKATDTIGDFSTLRSLTLNGSIGSVAIPAGTYGELTSNGTNTFVLGVAGATEPAVYNLQRLTLNGNSTIQIVGPVVLRLAYGVNFNGSGVSGAADQSFVIEIASGDLTLNGSVALTASVVVPSGRVTINGSTKLTGRVQSDSLTINSKGLLIDPGL